LHELSRHALRFDCWLRKPELLHMHLFAQPNS
jgi:hypothetical protein